MTAPNQVAELFLTLDLRTQKIEEQLRSVEQNLDAFSRKARDTKQATTEASQGADAMGGALGKLAGQLNASTIAQGGVVAALTLIGTTALGVAEDFDTATRKIAVSSANLGRDLGGIKEQLRQVARDTQTTLDDVSVAAEAVARQGVDNLQDLTQRVRATIELAKASGESVQTVAGGLDQILDAFGLDSGRVGAVTEQLFALSAAGVPLRDLLATLQQAAPGLREAGLGFEEAAGALATLIQQGFSARQAAAQFKALAKEGEEGAAKLREYADQARFAGGPTAQLAESVKLLKDGLAAANKELDFSRSLFLERLGEKWIGVAEAVARAGNAYFDFLDASDRLEQRQRAFIQNFFDPAPSGTRVTGAAPGLLRPLPEGGNPFGFSGGGGLSEKAIARAARAAEAAQARAARDTTKALGELRKLLVELQGELLPVENRFAALREELERLSAAAGPAGEKLAAAAQRTLTILEAIETKPTVTGGPTDTVLGVRPADAERLAEFLGKSADEIRRFFEAAGNGQRAEELAALFKEINAMQDFASGIGAVAQAMGDLGQATGLVGEETAKVLSQFGGLVDSAGQLSGTLKAFQAGEANLGQVLGSAASFGSGFATAIADAFGESPAVREATEALKRNADQLRENTAALVDLSITGNEQSQFTKFLDEFFTTRLPELRQRPRISTGAVEDALDEFNISLEELQRWAEEAGIEFVPLTRETLPQFLQFLTDLGIRLEEATIWGSGFTGELNKLTTGFKFSGADGAAQFKALVELLIDPEKGAPAIFALLDGIDVSTAEGAAKARDLIQEIFGSLEGLDKEAFNNLTFQQVIDVLLQMLGILPTFEAELTDAEKAVEKFTEGMAALSRAARVFDLSAIEQVERFFDLVADLAPAIGNQLGSFDLTTIEGMEAAIAYLQDLFLRVEDGTISLEGMGFTIDDIVDAIDRLQGAAADAADEVERLAEEEERRAAQAARDAERAAEDARRAQERANEEARRAAEQAERDRVATGDRGLRNASAQARLFDIDGLDLLRFRAGVFNQGSGGLFNRITGGADLGDRAGQQAALDALRQFFLTNPNGVNAGVFSDSAVQQQVLDLAELLKEQLAIDVTGGGQVESFGFNRTITEASADRLSGLLGTGNILAEEQLLELQAIRALLTPLSPVTIQPPALPAGSVAAGTSVGSITLMLSVGGSEPVPGSLSAATQAQVRDLVAQIVRELSIQQAGGA